MDLNGKILSKEGKGSFIRSDGSLIILMDYLQKATTLNYMYDSHLLLCFSDESESPVHTSIIAVSKIKEFMFELPDLVAPWITFFSKIRKNGSAE